MSLLAINLALEGRLPYQPSELTTLHTACIAAGGFIGGLFPDIDIHNSRAGQAVGGLSRFIEKTIGHRTFFHSILCYALIAFVMLKYINGEWVYWFVVPFLFGAASHLLLDMCNRSGIQLLFPAKKRFHIMTAELNGPVEKLTCVLCFCSLVTMTVRFISKIIR